MENRLKIYTDFDGTITKKDTWMDIGDYFIRDKEKWAEVISKFENLEIGARECFLTECSLIEKFDFEKFNKIIDNQTIDENFLDFKNYCDRNRIPITILSEGMDYYIGRILKNNNIRLPYFANRFVLHEDKKKFHLEFPYADSDCEKCGCCKRNLILNMTADDEISVLIGDGFSDVCASEYADIVFAKKSLASYCWKNNITYFEFNDFGNIKRKLEKILMQKKIKHRQAAKYRRKDVYLRG